jgi:hypothetical protein
MKVYGVSQSSGLERRLFIERGGEGVVLSITDHVGNKERARIMVPANAILAAITDSPPGGTTIEGIAPPHGGKMLLDIEIRRNEVLLAVRLDAGAIGDVAVGLDDLQDALEQAISKA